MNCILYSQFLARISLEVPLLGHNPNCIVIKMWSSKCLYIKLDIFFNDQLCMTFPYVISIKHYFPTVFYLWISACNFHSLLKQQTHVLMCHKDPINKGYGDINSIYSLIFRLSESVKLVSVLHTLESLNLNILLLYAYTSVKLPNKTQTQIQEITETNQASATQFNHTELTDDTFLYAKLIQ